MKSKLALLTALFALFLGIEITSAHAGESLSTTDTSGEENTGTPGEESMSIHVPRIPPCPWVSRAEEKIDSCMDSEPTAPDFQKAADRFCFAINIRQHKFCTKFIVDCEKNHPGQVTSWGTKATTYTIECTAL